MEKGLLSIVTPCYNSGAFMHRLMDSILIQDYHSIEMFCIDDGSTDNTSDVIKSYISRFDERGYSLTYIYQNNGGQAAAIDRGIKLAKGEFLAWPDSDDYYTQTSSVSLMIDKLQSLDDSFGLVKCEGVYVDSETQKLLNWHIAWDRSERLFDACITGKRFQIVPINYIVRIVAFDRVNPLRDIYTGRFPQNLQMLLPLLYTFKCHTMQESLCNIVVRNDSHSHSTLPYPKVIDAFEGYYEIECETMKRMVSMSKSERDKYERICKIEQLEQCLNFSILYYKIDEAKHYAVELKKLGIDISYGKKIKIELLRYPSLLKLIMNVKGGTMIR